MDTDAETGGNRRNEIDFKDQQDELAGRENGRMKRFLSPEARPEVQEEKRREAAYRSMLDYLLLNDPEYRALYEKVRDRLAEIDHAVAEALQEVNERIARMEEEAHTLNGKKVFFSRDGKRAYTEDGEEVSAADVGRITRNDDASTWEDYGAAKKEREGITRYQDDVLNPTRDRLEDKENPPSKDDLEGMLEDMEKQAPPAVQSKAKPHGQEATDIGYPKEKHLSNAPAIQSHFDAARTDIPDLICEPVSAPPIKPI